jgi:hypothetical protein
MIAKIIKSTINLFSLPKKDKVKVQLLEWKCQQQ